MNDSVLVLLWIETSTEISFKSKDCDGLNPLHFACVLGKVNCIKFFLRKSLVDINEKTNHRDNCLHLLIKYRQLTCIPLILLNTSKKPSMLCSNNRIEHDWIEEKPLILSSKNSDNKTPQDCYDDLPEQVKSKNRIFTFFLSFIKMTTLKQMELNLFVYRILLFSFPFFSFLIGILLVLFVWPQYRVIIFPVTSLISACFVFNQCHRISQLDSHQNPIFAGAFLSGVLHDLLCFRVNIYPSISTEWELIATGLILPIFTFCYCRILIVDPGELQISEIATKNFSTFLASNFRPSSNNPLPLDKFCQVCETAPNIDRVKHCKLCNMCVVNIDHHCLFLMTCIARNNTRNFIFLIVCSLTLIALFLEVAVKRILISCGPLSGASPLPYLYCSYTKETWVSVGVVFNAVSWLWGIAMLYNQLNAVGYHSTYYYMRGRHNSRSPLIWRVYRIVYFLLRGRYYMSNDERRAMANI